MVILLSLGLFAFAVGDLIRWAPTEVSKARAYAALGGSVVVTAAVAALSGMEPLAVGAVAMGTAAVVAIWIGFDYLPLTGRLAGAQLTWIGVVLLVLFSFSGSVDPISGPIERWYAHLDFAFVASVSVDQFVLGLGAVLFMTATANRIVRLVLDAAGIAWKRSEGALRGGRVLGPLERLIIFAIVLAGDPAAAAIVVTGKGLLRFPELRSESRQSGPDAVTEYFLIGTFSSLLVAALLGVLVLASS